MEKANRPTSAFIGVIVVGFALYFFMNAVQGRLTAVMFDYNEWWQQLETSVLYRVLWMIGDMTEPHFHKTIFGGAFVTIGSIIAYYLDKKQSPLGGTPICYGSGLWPWVFAASMLSLGISNFIYGGLRLEDGWVATFIPYVSVPGALILIYGGNMSNLITAAILGAMFTSPIATFIRIYICGPWGMPGIVGNTGAMWIGGIFCCEVARFLPWMKAVPKPVAAPGTNTAPDKAYKLKKPNTFFIRRMLADYSEPMFVGTELAGALLVAGTLLTWFLSPNQPVYGSGLLAPMLLNQIITGAVAIYVYWDRWVESDYFPSFIPVVSVGPAMILSFPPSMFVIVFTAIVGALITPPLADMVNRNIPSHWHPLIGFTFTMFFCSLCTVMLMRLLLASFPFLG